MEQVAVFEYFSSVQDGGILGVMKEKRVKKPWRQKIKKVICNVHFNKILNICGKTLRLNVRKFNVICSTCSIIFHLHSPPNVYLLV